MSEYASHNQEQEPALPDMELADIIESMEPEHRIAEKRRLLSEISDREYLVNLINEANEAEDVDISIIY